MDAMSRVLISYSKELSIYLTFCKTLKFKLEDGGCYGTAR